MPKTKTKRIKKKKGKTKNKKTINKIRLLKKKIKEEIELANKKKLPEIRGLSGMNLPPGITSFYDSNLASRIKSNDALAVERNTQTILDEQAKMIKEQAKNDPRIKQAEEMEKAIIKLKNKPEDEDKKFTSFMSWYNEDRMDIDSKLKKLNDRLSKLMIEDDEEEEDPKIYEVPPQLKESKVPSLKEMKTISEPEPPKEDVPFYKLLDAELEDKEEKDKKEEEPSKGVTLEALKNREIMINFFKKNKSRKLEDGTVIKFSDYWDENENKFKYGKKKEAMKLIFNLGSLPSKDQDKKIVEKIKNMS
jgi:hypothetical protein